MTGKIKVLLPLLLIFLLVGCGKTDDGLTIEGHDWTYANAIDRNVTFQTFDNALCLYTDNCQYQQQSK